jgi:uncharacterized repeat protein (TIGR01451 family)
LVQVSLPEIASPGAPVAYTVSLFNLSPVTLTHLLLTDTLPAETAFTSYQADDFTCTHDGAVWGGNLSCTLDSLSLAPGESRVLTVTVILSDGLHVYQDVTNNVFAMAEGDGETYRARGQARTTAVWCTVQLNDIPMGSDLQAAIDASTQPTDVVKISGYCPVHDLGLNKTLVLQGGWRYGFSEWDPGVYTTTLDAQTLGQVILVDGDVAPTIADFVITGGKTSESGGGISISTGSPMIQDNTIAGNYAEISGGGLYNLSGNPTVQNNIFRDNRATSGAGMYTELGSPSILDNAFSLNSTPSTYSGGGSGAGLYNGSGNPIIQNNTFTHNVIGWGWGSYGGGIYNGSGSPLIQNNTFTGNSVDYYSLGGGLYNGSGSPIIQNNLFTGNTAHWSGGGLYNQDGNPTIQNNTIISNTAYQGGGLANGSGSPLIQDNIFAENSAGLEGGGFYTFVSSPIIQNNIFNGNTAKHGGGLYTIGNGTIIQNNTFRDNTAENGGGVFIESSPVIRSNIIVENTALLDGGGIFISTGGTPALRYNDVWSNTGGNYYGVDPGAHDISANPRLVDPDNGDFHLSSSSPCINKADPVDYPPTDFEGDTRPHGAAPDIGADEFYSR